ncbi:MerR family transcriptional regulator [Actinoplanes sp. NPDC051494]|uniref:MerR family transcriptional regulator n=1 Tax=Actinoplanes sp. NPDC051494 TaxID=3363907 RepID=UPI0037A69C87
MDELVDRVGRALAAEYAGAPNGRVRDVPDRRAVRWYTTIGLVDRPSGMKGRNALYEQRHLLQLVAIKRRQAQGHSLAAIQAELTGASEDLLAEVARVPVAVLTTDHREVGDTPHDVARPRFWTASPALAEAAPAVDLSARPGETRHPRPDICFLPTGAMEIGGIALGGGAILVIPVRPSPADLAAVTAAAQPLLTLLHDRGLLRTDDGSPT